MKEYTLNKVKVSDTVILKKLKSEGSIRRRLLDIGFIPGTKIECVLTSPFKDPTLYRIRGTLIAIRSDDAKNIIVEELYEV